MKDNNYITVGKMYFETDEQFKVYCSVLIDNAEIFIETIAKTIHALNKKWCEFNNDYHHVDYDHCSEDQKEALIRGVKAILINPNITAKDHHDIWVLNMKGRGWKYNSKRNIKAKEHPCLVPFEVLSDFEKWKNEMFITTVIEIVKNTAGIVMFDTFAKLTSISVTTQDDEQNNLI